MEETCMISWKTTRHILYGFLAGTAGVKIFSGRIAKKVYTHITAAALRGADDVMSRAEIIKDAKEKTRHSIQSHTGAS